MSTKPITALVDVDASDPLSAANGFAGQDILSVSQFNRDNMTSIFRKSHEMRELIERQGSSDLLRGQDSDLSVLRAQHPHERLLHRCHGTTGWQRHPDHPGRAV